MYEHTLASSFTIEGIGVHGGRPVSMRFSPAPPRSGVVFFVPGADGVRRPVPARASRSARQDLATVLAGPGGIRVLTIEHVMAALAACGIDNAAIGMDGDEPAIMDGGSSSFVDGIRSAGTIVQAAGRRHLRVLKRVRVEVAIEFEHAAVGRQEFAFETGVDDFASELAPARTFGFERDAVRLRAAGLARGASLENTVVLSDDGAVLNPEGLRYPDEFVRHKTLDAIGDQALAGSRILGCFASFRGGHSLNAAALAELLDDGDAFEMETATSGSVRAGIGFPIGAVAESC